MVAHGARFLLPFALLAVGAAAAGLLLAASAEASHLRGGTLSWKAVDGDTVEAVGGFAFRASAIANPAIGTVTCQNYLGPTGGCILLTESGPDGSVAGVLVAPDGGPLLLDLDPSASHAIGTDTCCWPSSTPALAHHNNPDALFSVPSTVRFGAGSPPAFAWTPVVGCAPGATCTFRVPARDPDGDAVTYALATTEAGAGFRQPAGLAIDPATGQVTWQAPADPSPGYDAWSVAITATDGTHVAITEFLVELEAPACGWGGPPPVTGLAASAANGKQPRVDLTWTPALAGLCPSDRVRVERSETGAPGSFAPLADLPAGAAAYTDATAERCRAYWYRVYETVGGRGFPWATVQATLSIGGVPGAPTVSASLATAPLSATLSWTPTEEGSSQRCPTLRYDVYRATGAGDPVLLGSTDGTSFNDTGLRACASHTYTVRAVNTAGASEAGAAVVEVGEAAQPAPWLQAFSWDLNRVQVTWTLAPDNGCGIGAVEFWKDGARLATYPAPAHPHQGYQYHDLQPGTPCTQIVYQVRAMSVAGTPGEFATVVHRHDPGLLLSGRCPVGL
jgi:hypothetical protein